MTDLLDVQNKNKHNFIVRLIKLLYLHQHISYIPLWIDLFLFSRDSLMQNDRYRIRQAKLKHRTCVRGGYTKPWGRGHLILNFEIKQGKYLSLGDEAGEFFFRLFGEIHVWVVAQTEVICNLFSNFQIRHKGFSLNGKAQTQINILFLQGISFKKQQQH